MRSDSENLTHSFLAAIRGRRLEQDPDDSSLAKPPTVVVPASFGARVQYGSDPDVCRQPGDRGSAPALLLSFTHTLSGEPDELVLVMCSKRLWPPRWSADTIAQACSIVRMFPHSVLLLDGKPASTLEFCVRSTSDRRALAAGPLLARSESLVRAFADATPSLLSLFDYYCRCPEESWYDTLVDAYRGLPRVDLIEDVLLPARALASKGSFLPSQNLCALSFGQQHQRGQRAHLEV